LGNGRVNKRLIAQGDFRDCMSTGHNHKIKFDLEILEKVRKQILNKRDVFYYYVNYQDFRKSFGRDYSHYNESKVFWNQEKQCFEPNTQQIKLTITGSRAKNQKFF